MRRAMHKPSRRWHLVLLAFALSVAAVGCGGSDSDSGAAESTTNDAAEQSNKPVRIAFSGFAAANSFTQETLKGIEEVAAANNATVEFLDAAFDATKQVAQIQDATTSGSFDAILIHANNNTALVPAIDAAAREGIKVVSVFVPIGSDLNDVEPQVEGVTAAVGMSPASTGENTAKLIVEACADKDPCKVAYLPGNKTLPLENARTEGAMSILEQETNIEVVSTQEGGYTADAGLKATQNLLQAHSDVDVIASSDQAIQGAAIAVKNAGKTGEIALIGQGASRQAIAGIKDGTWFGSAVYVPYSEGKKAAELAIAAVRGEDFESYVDSYSLSPIGGMVSKDNVADFDGEWSS